MENLGYYNGTYGPLETMTVPMNDRACYFGDGIFEVAYVRNYRIYSAEEHMDRLYESARELGIRIPLTKEEFLQLLSELVRKVDSHEQLLYWQVSRGTAMRAHAPEEELCGNIWVTIRPKKLASTYEPMKLITVEDKRFYFCHMKTLNLLPTVLASQEAQRRGADEAIFHRSGRVTECAHSNISIIQEDGSVKTAPADHLILAGIARGHFLRTCREFGVPVYEEPYTVEELMRAREVIVTSSGTLCRPAVSVDGITLGARSPELLPRLQDALFRDFLQKTEI